MKREPLQSRRAVNIRVVAHLSMTLRLEKRLRPPVCAKRLPNSSSNIRQWATTHIQMILPSGYVLEGSVRV